MRDYKSAAEATSLLSSVASLAIRALLVLFFQILQIEAKKEIFKTLIKIHSYVFLMPPGKRGTSRTIK